MRDWLVLDLAGPLMAFGGVAIDQVGPVRPWPSASMLTGLIANALGWDWSDRAEHQDLQDRLTFASAGIREGSVLTDMQNVKMAKADKGWTTRGTPEGRAGASYDAPHRRTRDYHADRHVRVVLALDPPDKSPDLEAVRDALIRPVRPLFLGRKPCLPSRPLVPVDGNLVTAANAFDALALVAPGLPAQWPAGHGPQSEQGLRTIPDHADLRIWTLGLHGGARAVVEGRLPEQAQP